MSIDLYIRIVLYVDPDTGLPHVYKRINDKVEKALYKAEDYKVPTEFCKYFYQHGKHFRYYTALFHSLERETTASSFLSTYPNWEDVYRYKKGVLNDWSEDDHNEFKKALEWFATKDDVFMIHWE